MADPTISPAKPAASAKPAKPKGKILLPNELLTQRKPVQERTGLEYEGDALESFNAKANEDYERAFADAKSRGLAVSNVPKPKIYGASDVFASVLVKDAVNGDRVGIVLNDAKKFYYQL